MMIIEWLGHASFLIISDSGTKIVTDPYQSGGYGGAIGYDSIKLSPDIVTISHSHIDHSYADSLLGEPKIINKTGQFKIKDVRIKGIRAFHDEQKGKARGENIIFSFNIDGIDVVHLGDLGHELDINLIKEIANIDILLIPTGGTFTIGPEKAESLIGNLKPKLVIPMHFKTKKIGFEIEPIESFLKLTKFPIKKQNSSSITVNKNILNNNTKIYVLKHSH